MVLLRPSQSRGTDLPATGLPLIVALTEGDSRNSENTSCCPVADWSFARDVQEVELQLASESRSRTVWVLVHQGQAYVPCSLGFPPGKRWHEDADQDGRAMLRIDGRRYPVTLKRTDDPALGDALRAEVQRKYTNVPSTSGGVWIFQVTSRSPEA